MKRTEVFLVLCVLFNAYQRSAYALDNGLLRQPPMVKIEDPRVSSDLRFRLSFRVG